MRAVVQRVSRAGVSVNGTALGEIGRGLCVLAGISPDDTEEDLRWMAEKITNLRIFSDEDGKMNRSLVEIGGSILAISQFTLFADCRKGRRPSFVGAAPYDLGYNMFLSFLDILHKAGVSLKTGEYGADMKVDIVNDGPVTIIIDTKER